MEHNFEHISVRERRVDRAESARIADDSAQIAAVHQSVAEDEKRDRTEAEVEQVFHDDVACVFCAGEARFDHREARLHKEDEADADKHPDKIAFGQVCVDVGQCRRQKCRCHNTPPKKYGAPQRTLRCDPKKYKAPLPRRLCLCNEYSPRKSDCQTIERRF